MVLPRARAPAARVPRAPRSVQPTAASSSWWTTSRGCGWPAGSARWSSPERWRCGSAAVAPQSGRTAPRSPAGTRRDRLIMASTAHLDPPRPGAGGLCWWPRSSRAGGRPRRGRDGRRQPDTPAGTRSRCRTGSPPSSRVAGAAAPGARRRRSLGRARLGLRRAGPDERQPRLLRPGAGRPRPVDAPAAHGNAAAAVGLGALANARHDLPPPAPTPSGAGARSASIEANGVLADAATSSATPPRPPRPCSGCSNCVPGWRRSARLLRAGAARSTRRGAGGPSARWAPRPAARNWPSATTTSVSWPGAAAVWRRRRHYKRGLAAALGPGAAAGPGQGLAASGRVDEAITAYDRLTRCVPLPQYLIEYGELLESAGRLPEARAQYGVSASSGSSTPRRARPTTDRRAAGRRPTGTLQRRSGWPRPSGAAGRNSPRRRWPGRCMRPAATPKRSPIERAGALGRRDATVDYRRGMILAGLGPARTGEAIAALDEALATNPHFSPLDAAVAAPALKSLDDPLVRAAGRADRARARVVPCAGRRRAAHPLGNFTVNQYDGLRLYADRVDLLAVVDHAEIPTLQERPLLAHAEWVVARRGPGPGRRGVRRPGRRRRRDRGRRSAHLVRPGRRADSPPGEAGLSTTHIECGISAPPSWGEPPRRSTDSYLADRIGWGDGRPSATASG